jgi:hypothetical protein
MKKSLLTVALATALMIAWSIGRVQGQASSKGKVIFVSADEANYQAMGTSTGVSTAAIFGDASKGAHATFSKFAPGYDAGMHTHTNDVWIVGVKGAYLYKDEAGEKRIGPGRFLAGARRPQALERRRSQRGSDFLRRIVRNVRLDPSKIGKSQSSVFSLSAHLEHGFSDDRRLPHCCSRIR